MIYEKRYIQYNDLVFDGYDMISGYDSEVAFKTSSVEYSYGNGNYRPFKSNYNYVSAGSVTMTITLNMKKVPCDMRNFYMKFAEQELSKSGKLWAIKNNEIIWAYAEVTNLSMVISNSQNKVVYDVSFSLPEGVWHKADKQKTFVVPYDVCIYMDCRGFKEDNWCETASKGGDCCYECLRANSTPINDDCFCCCVDHLDPDMALCYHRNELQALYSCETPFQLVYSCTDAEKFSTNAYLGKKLCTDLCHDNIVAGQFYSETDLPTDATVILVGEMVNPMVTINGNTNIINGEYSGALIIDASGDVYYQTDDCCDPELLDPSVWEVPSGDTYGWTVNPLNNSIIVNRNSCCDRFCIYIQDNPITI